METKYLEALAKVRAWKLEAGELLLVANGEVLARLTTKPANASTAVLEALTFNSKVYQGVPVKLTHGEYRTPAAPGSASEVVIKLGAKRAFGTLNGGESGVVVVTTSRGGAGAADYSRDTSYDQSAAPRASGATLRAPRALRSV